MAPNEVIEIALPDGREIRIEPVEDPKPGQPRLLMTLHDSKTGDLIAELDSVYLDEGNRVRWNVPPQ